MKYFVVTKEKTKEMLFSFIRVLESKGLEPIDKILLERVIDDFLDT